MCNWLAAYSCRLLLCIYIYIYIYTYILYTLYILRVYIIYIYGSTCQRVAIPISGDPWRVFRFDMGKSNFCLKRLIIMEGIEIRTHDPKRHVLPSSPFVKALLCPATGKKLSFGLPKVSLLTLSPPGTRDIQVQTGYVHIIYYQVYIIYFEVLYFEV